MQREKTHCPGALGIFRYTLSLVTPYKGALPPTNHFGCAEGALRFAAPSPPLREPYLFCAGMARNASGGPFFSVLPEKNGEKRGAGDANGAVAPEKLFVSLYVLSFCFRRLNALRAAVGSGFPSARHAVQVALFAPVEYLTYGIRRVCDFLRLVGADVGIGPYKRIISIPT